MATEIRLLGGENFAAFTMPCVVNTSACVAKGADGRSGTVTLMPNYKQLQCCRPCFDTKLASGEWSYQAPVKPKRPPYEEDAAPEGSDALRAAFAELVAWKKKIAGGPAAHARCETKLSLRGEPSGITVRWFGWYESDLLEELLALLASERIAPHVAALEIAGEAAGANGTRNWDLKKLVAGAALPRLARVVVERTKPDDHNQTIVGDYTSSEGGVLGRLLDKAPALAVLESPSAPDASFFRRASHPLARLVVQTGYDHQDFVANLAASSCFSALELLDFTDSTQTYLDDFEAQRTPVTSYGALFASSSLPSLRAVILRGTKLGRDDVARLRATKVGEKLARLSIVPFEGSAEEEEAVTMEELASLASQVREVLDGAREIGLPESPELREALGEIDRVISGAEEATAGTTHDDEVLELAWDEELAAARFAFKKFGVGFTPVLEKLVSLVKERRAHRVFVDTALFPGYLPSFWRALASETAPRLASLGVKRLGFLRGPDTTPPQMALTEELFQGSGVEAKGFTKPAEARAWLAQA